MSYCKSGFKLICCPCYHPLPLPPIPLPPLPFLCHELPKCCHLCHLFLTAPSGLPLSPDPRPLPLPGLPPQPPLSWSGRCPPSLPGPPTSPLPPPPLAPHLHVLSLLHPDHGLHGQLPIPSATHQDAHDALVVVFSSRWWWWSYIYWDLEIP
uniref:Uncharacterized protein n=1 Tax=Amphimedon queenslandica TaxID=400682 RepID=A0A1X7VQL1_AMPQE